MLEYTDNIYKLKDGRTVSVKWVGGNNNAYVHTKNSSTFVDTSELKSFIGKTATREEVGLTLQETGIPRGRHRHGKTQIGYKIAKVAFGTLEVHVPTKFLEYIPEFLEKAQTKGWTAEITKPDTILVKDKLAA